MDTSSALIPSKKIRQIAFLVKDINKARQHWETLLGIPMSEVMLTGPQEETKAELDGKPSTGRAKLGFFDLENIQIELIEPQGGESIWQRDMDAKGEGVHHIAFQLPDGSEAMQRCPENGMPLTQWGEMGSANRYIYFEAESTIGTNIELLETGRA